MALGLLGLGEKPGRLDHDLDTEGAPREFRRGLGAHDLDLVAVDDEDVVLGLVSRGLLGGDGARKFSLR